MVGGGFLAVMDLFGMHLRELLAGALLLVGFILATIGLIDLYIAWGSLQRKGLGADLSSFVENLKAAKVILIDGCPVACGKITVEKHGIKPKEYYVISELGIKKSHSYADLEAETSKARKQIVKNP